MKKSRRWSIILATLIAVATVATCFFTAGVFVLFGVGWSCVPAHNIDGKGCADYVFPLTMVLVPAACLVIGILVGKLVRKRTRHWDDDANAKPDLD